MSEETMPEKIHASFAPMSEKSGYWTTEPAFTSELYREYTRSDLVPRWVSVEERLPEPGDVCVVVGPFEDPVTAYRIADAEHGYRWQSTWDHERMTGVTHWMPIPPVRIK